MIDRENAFIAERLKEILRTMRQGGEDVFETCVGEIACFVKENEDRIVEALERNLPGGGT